MARMSVDADLVVGAVDVESALRDPLPLPVDEATPLERRDEDPVGPRPVAELFWTDVLPVLERALFARDVATAFDRRASRIAFINDELETFAGFVVFTLL